jgi:hypothetical protein
MWIQLRFLEEKENINFDLICQRTSINRWFCKDEIVCEGVKSIVDCLERRTFIFENDENFPSITLSSKLRDTESSVISAQIYQIKMKNFFW